ncbi:DUF3761 domain-containing protein [Methylobacterium sp. WSM2598]|uniref:DUF3761 domain-containing protein n=1 Tax=Methylobacterium sp. WSM2598 TaxID=398261 RepID=UPI001F216738|nr:DUF3761 domain-containing protein [Methylobacterium sp. WSM2598]
MQRVLVRSLIASGTLITLLASGAAAREFREPNENTLDRHGRYINRDGRSVHQPAHTRDGSKPEGATAHCRDGTWSFSRHRAGTCSGHHGVASWE